MSMCTGRGGREGQKSQGREQGAKEKRKPYAALRASYARGGQLCERRPAMREEASMSNRRRARERGERRPGESISDRRGEGDWT